jgi:RNA polymerase sigma-70 factor (ECF subfamily)
MWAVGGKPQMAASLDPGDTLVEDNLAFIWRLLRRLGLPEAQVDDAVQEVFIVAMRRRAEIVAGRERSFLYGTALRVASDARRAAARRRESGSQPLELVPASSPDPEELLAEKQARAMLDEILQQMDLDLRAVFVLFELEGMTTVEIAACIEVPVGTVASRLARARKEFSARVKRLQLKRGIK